MNKLILAFLNVMFWTVLIISFLVGCDTFIKADIAAHIPQQVQQQALPTDILEYQVIFSS